MRFPRPDVPPAALAALAAALLVGAGGLGGCEKKVSEASRPVSPYRASSLQADVLSPRGAASVDGTRRGTPGGTRGGSSFGTAPAAALDARPARSATSDVRSTTSAPRKAIEAETMPCCGGATTSARLTARR